MDQCIKFLQGFLQLTLRTTETPTSLQRSATLILDQFVVPTLLPFYEPETIHTFLQTRETQCQPQCTWIEETLQTLTTEIQVLDPHLTLYPVGPYRVQMHLADEPVIDCRLVLPVGQRTPRQTLLSHLTHTSWTKLAPLTYTLSHATLDLRLTLKVVTKQEAQFEYPLYQSLQKINPSVRAALTYLKYLLHQGEQTGLYPLDTYRAFCLVLVYRYSH